MKEIISLPLIAALLASMSVTVSAAPELEWLEPNQITLSSAKTNPGSDYFCGIPGEKVAGISGDGVGHFLLPAGTERCLYLRWDISGYSIDEISDARILFNSDSANVDLYSLPDTEWDTDTAPMLTNAALISNKASDAEIPDGYSYNRKYDVADHVKAAIENSQEYFVLVIGPKNGNQIFGIYINKLNVDKQKPALQIQRTTNKAPVVTIETQTGEVYDIDFAEEIVVTATGTDPNEGETETLEYEFYVDGEVNTDNVSANVLTLPGGTLSPGTHVIKVRCTDVNGAYTYAELQINGCINSFSDMEPIEIKGVLANGKSGGFLSSSSASAEIKEGAENRFIVWSNFNDGLLYMKYPLSEVEAHDVSKAVIRLSIQSSEAASQINFYIMSEEWSIGDPVPQTDMSTVAATIGVDSQSVYTSVEIDLTELVRSELNNGKTCLVLAAASDEGYFSVSNVNDGSTLVVTNTTNSRPSVRFISPIGYYIEADKSTHFSVTAEDADNNLEEIKLYVDNEELSDIMVNGSEYSAYFSPTKERHVLKAVAVDAKGCSRTIEQNVNVRTAIVNSNLTGNLTPGGMLSAEYIVENKSLIKELKCYVIVAVYNAQGDPYSIRLKTVTVDIGGSENGVLDMTIDKTVDDLTGYTASAMVWSDELLMLTDAANIN